MKIKQIILVGLVVIVSLFVMFSFQTEQVGKEVNIQGGILSGYTKEEVEAMLQKEADKNSFSFEINARPVFKNGSSEGNLRIANPPYSAYAIDVEIYLDETGELVFSSGIIQPEQYIEYAQLTRNLSEGVYKATATIRAFDLETEEYKGKSAAGLTIEIQN